MLHDDPVLCEAFKNLTNSIHESNKKIDDAIINQQHLDNKIVQVLSAFPDGVDKHREYHEAIIKAKKAEEEFWIDLRQEVIKKGIVGALVILIGLIWLGAQAWAKLHLIR